MRVHQVLSGVVLLTGVPGCFDHDRPNVDPCMTAYDADGFISVVGAQHQLCSFSVFPQNFRSKMPLDPDTVECGVIQASLGFQGVQPVGNDSFAISIAQAFFHLPKNSAVQRLHLEIESVVDAVGKETVHYLFDRARADSAHAMPLRVAPVAESECVVVHEEEQSINFGDGWNPALTITAHVPHVPHEMRALAVAIKARYDARIRKEGIRELTVDIHVMEPSCSLCDSQVYSFFYVKENHNL